MQQEKIPFYVDRDFGQTFGSGLKFLRQNLKLLFQCLLYFSGPFILIAGIITAYYQASAIQNIAMLRSGMYVDTPQQYGLMYWLSLLGSMIAQASMIGTSYSFLLTYNEKGPGNFTVSDVGKTFSKNIGNIISVFFSMLLFVAIAVGVFFLATMLFSSMGPIFIVLWVLALIVGILILFPPLLWLLNTVYLAKMQENINAFFAFTRVREIMKGNFWWTWLIVVCSVISVVIVSYIFLLPQFIYTIVIVLGAFKGDADTDISITFIIISTICLFLSSMLYNAIFIINGFHYYSLVEKKEKKGLISRIDELGNNTGNNVEQHY